LARETRYGDESVFDDAVAMGHFRGEVCTSACVDVRSFFTITSDSSLKWNRSRVIVLWTPVQLWYTATLTLVSQISGLQVVVAQIRVLGWRLCWTDIKMRNKRRKKRLKKRAAKNCKKLSRHQPNEEFSFGPLRIARYGKINVFENYASAEEFAEMQKRAADGFEDLCRSISEDVEVCRQIIRRYNPLNLLQRVYWSWFNESLDAPYEESSQSAAKLNACQLLEYVQKLLYAEGCDQNTTNVSDVDFCRLEEATKRIFERLAFDYFLCRSGKQAQRPNYKKELDVYSIRTEMNWISVRGLRYLSQEADYFRRILTAQSSLLQETYGLTVTQIVEGLTSLIESLTKGVGRVVADLEEFRNDTLNAIDADRSNWELPPPVAMEKVVSENGWEARRDSIFSRFLGSALFDVKELTQWPEEFIADLSCGLSEDKGFMSDSTNACWPTADSVLRFKPFIRLQNKSYCFFVRGLTDYLYRSIEAGIRKRTKNIERWNRGQKRASEEFTADLFSRLLPGARIIVEANYWMGSSADKTKTECDILVIFDRTLFVIEVKSGRYTHRPPGARILDHLKSIRDLIESAAIQANRFVDNLQSQGELEILDKKGDLQLLLISSSIDQIFRCCVSLDQIDDIASRSEDLAKLGIAIGPHPIWTLSINDLLVLAEVFTNPLIFVDYVGERLRAFASKHCHVSDELDHVGLYFKHNRYSVLADGYAPMHCEGWIGFRDEFDRYYGQKWVGKSSSLPTLELPKWLNQIISCFLKASSKGMVRAANRLLEMDEKTKTHLGQQISRARKIQRKCKRPRPLSTMGDVRVTVFVDQRHLVSGLSYAQAREFVMCNIVMENESDRLLLYLDCKSNGEINEVLHDIISRQDVEAVGEEILWQKIEQLRNSRNSLHRRDIQRFRK
jgi:hypothetical protein